MTTLNNETPPHYVTASHVSILDFFVPGSTSIFAIFEQLLAGKSTSFASILCICGVLLYMVKRIAFGVVGCLVRLHFEGAHET
jgi:hypothetical protein